MIINWPSLKGLTEDIRIDPGKSIEGTLATPGGGTDELVIPINNSVLYLKYYIISNDNLDNSPRW